ncbi:unnamed protein product [Merluccius merluccius]
MPIDRPALLDVALKKSANPLHPILSLTDTESPRRPSVRDISLERVQGKHSSPGLFLVFLYKPDTITVTEPLSIQDGTHPGLGWLHHPPACDRKADRAFRSL